MPKEFSRGLRVADQIQREIADLLRTEVKDPRVGFVTLTGVEVTPDYTHAKVFFTCMDGHEKADEAAVGLHRAGGFLRRELGYRIRLHHIPELHFVFDASVENGMRLSKLIDEAVATSSDTEDS
jgi:ribosome-binding factor A